MLQIAASALPANVPGAVAANPAAQVPSAYGAASAAPTVPVQLPAAVVASGAVAAYQPNTPQTSKPAVRLASASQPSSLLAAQYLAQTPDASGEDLQLFEPVAATPAPTAEDESLSYLKDLRVANGELPPAPEAEVATTATRASASARPSSAANPNVFSLPLAAATSQAQVAGQALVLKTAPPIQARPAPAPLAPAGKKPTIGQARDGDAYKLAEARNFSTSFPTSVAAIF